MREADRPDRVTMIRDHLSTMNFPSEERACSGGEYGLYPVGSRLFVNAGTMIVWPLYKHVKLSRCSNSIGWPETVGCSVSVACHGAVAI